MAEPAEKGKAERYKPDPRLLNVTEAQEQRYTEALVACRGLIESGAALLHVVHGKVVTAHKGLHGSEDWLEKDYGLTPQEAAALHVNGELLATVPGRLGYTVLDVDKPAKRHELQQDAVQEALASLGLVAAFTNHSKNGVHAWVPNTSRDQSGHEWAWGMIGGQLRGTKSYVRLFPYTVIDLHAQLRFAEGEFMEEDISEKLLTLKVAPGNVTRLVRGSKRRIGKELIRDATQFIKIAPHRNARSLAKYFDEAVTEGMGGHPSAMSLAGWTVNEGGPLELERLNSLREVFVKYRKEKSPGSEDPNQEFDRVVKFCRDCAGTRVVDEDGNIEDDPNVLDDRTEFSKALAAVGAEIRYNTLTGQRELRIAGHPTFNEWGDCNSNSPREAAVIVEIWRNVQWRSGPSSFRQLKYTPSDFRMLAKAEAELARVNSFSEWLEALPEWDGVERVETMFADVFKGVKKGDVLARWACRYLTCGAILRGSVKAGAKLDQVPVLVADVGVGKSELLRSLFPREFVNESVDLSLTGRSLRYQFIGKVLGVIDEMSGTDKDLAKVKSFVTQRYDSWDRKWESMQNEPRRYIMAATANRGVTGSLPNDPDGQRRFIPIPTGPSKVGRVEDWMAERVEQIWAEAFTRFTAGEAGWRNPALPWKLRDKAMKRAEQHRASDILFEDYVQSIRRGKRWPKGLFSILELASMTEPQLVPDTPSPGMSNETLREYDSKVQWFSGGGPQGPRMKFALELRAAGWTKQKRRRDGRVANWWTAP